MVETHPAASVMDEPMPFANVHSIGSAIRGSVLHFYQKVMASATRMPYKH